MLYERKKILIRRIIWLSISAILILLPILTRKSSDDLEIVDDNCYTIYYSSLDLTMCEMDITFNMEVESGYVTIKFYDANDYWLETVDKYFSSHGKYVENNYISVNGAVASYEIVSYDIEPKSPDFVYLSPLLFFTVFFFVASLTLSYKRYSVDGNDVIVYAGLYHHYIKINGEKYDEHNTALYFSAIHLSCRYNENLIESTISLSNRISTKLNGKLLNSAE